MTVHRAAADSHVCKKAQWAKGDGGCVDLYSLVPVWGLWDQQVMTARW